MATKTDTLAAKQRKQKIVLAALGVVLVALAAFQGPKLIDQLNGSSSTPATAGSEDSSATSTATSTDSSATSTGTSTDSSATPPGAAAGSVTTIAAPAGTPTAVLVGVDVPGSIRPAPAQGQLKTFTLFEPKDPFVQQLPPEPPAAEAKPPAVADGGGAQAPAGGQSDAAATGAGADATPAAGFRFATISINGDAQPVEVKKRFPKDEKLFVLVSLKPKSVKIAVAGGTFTDSETVTLQMNEPVTLVNTATGARYNLKLVYTGAQPEQVAGFVQGETSG